MAQAFSLKLLASPSTGRWTARRKASVAMAVARQGRPSGGGHESGGVPDLK